MVTKDQCKEWMDKYLPMTIIITVFMFGGTFSVIFSKTTYQTSAEGVNGDTHYFTKPLFFNWCMFLGMSLCLFIYVGQYHIKPLFKKKNDYSDLIEDSQEVKQEGKQAMTWKGYLMMLIPALCDFLATYLMNFALIVVSSSIFQMMKGSIIIFTAILAVLYRKHKLYPFEIVGVCILVLALAVIGSAAFCPGYQDVVESSLSGAEEAVSTWETAIGLLLIVIGMFLQALQTVVEEQLLHDISAPVSFVVGLEGIYGLVICSCMMPIMGMSWVPDAIYEDTKDSFIMLTNNPLIIVFVLSYIITTFMFNYAGMMITDYVNAMVRNVMEPLRMITIWIISVFLYYVVDKAIGEKVGLFTILEVIGFILLTLGFLLYTKVIKIPKLFNYPIRDLNSEEEYGRADSQQSSSDDSHKPLLDSSV